MMGAHGRASYLVATKDGKRSRFSPDGVIPLPPLRITGDTPPIESYDYTHIFGEAEGSEIPSKEALSALGDAMRPASTAAAPSPGDVDDGLSGIPAGYTYLGQFIAHDMSYLDPKTGNRNLRWPALDLDSVIPVTGPSGFLSNDPSVGPLAIGLTSTNESPRLPEDLPRHTDLPYGLPIIADDRNDSFLPLSQCHLLMLKFYNAIARHLGIDWHMGLRPEDGKAIRELWVKHFQYAVLHDYLPTIVGCDTYRCVRDGGRAIVHPCPFPRTLNLGPPNPADAGWMPLEFATAIGRYGHSMVRNIYEQWNRRVNEVTVDDFADLSYRNSGDGLNSVARAVPVKWINNWLRLLDFSETCLGPSELAPIMANRIDTNLAKPLSDLSNRLLASPPSDQTETFNLAARTLLQVNWCHLKSAQQGLEILNTSFKKMTAPPTPISLLAPDEICKADRAEAGVFNAYPELHTLTPLWFYMLREAEIKACGRHLGPFGGRIVMETIHAAIEASDISILDGKKWAPSFATRGHFTFADMVAFSGNPDPLDGY